MKVFVVFMSFCTFASLCFHVEIDKRINRIVGGEKAPFHYAYQISLQRFSPSYGFFASKNFTHFCGASIVGENHLVTAAHCVDVKNFSKIFALVGTSNLKDAGSGSRHPIQSCLIHENYVRLTSNTTSQNDIALCKVQFPFVFGDKVAKISLDKTYAPGDVNATLTGWGSVRKFRWLPFPFYDEIAYPNDLQRGFFPTISHEKCKEKHPKIEKNHICTFGGEGKGACSGDSGGPLVNDGKLIGIVSFGTMICANGNYDVYTRASEYVDWINSNMFLTSLNSTANLAIQNLIETLPFGFGTK